MTTAGSPKSSQGAGGPFFEDLRVGQLFDDAPSLTLTDGQASLHQAILGHRLRLALDATLSRRVLGTESPMAHPGLVCDVAIGQSTLATRRVIGNLFYRGLVLHRTPVIGDTLRTTTEVVALRQTTPRADRDARGLAVLRVRTVDQRDRRVLDFWRCAMLPLRDREVRTGHADDLEAIPDGLDLRTEALVGRWDLDAFRASVPSAPSENAQPGSTWEIEGGDVVSAAPELGRLSLNVAMAHHDASASVSGRRLVYGGHTIGIAGAQATRVLPDLLTIVAWRSCDHLGPVFEGDTLHSSLEVEARESAPGPVTLLSLRSRVEAVREQGAVDVLDWRFLALAA